MKAPQASIIGKKNTTAIRYWGSGAGREQYIVCNSGGNIPQYNSRSPMDLYNASLRQYRGPGETSFNDSTLKNNLVTPVNMTSGGRQVYQSVSP